jgi:3D (Asp-Asp-Asp) domain-containing protein
MRLIIIFYIGISLTGCAETVSENQTLQTIEENVKIGIFTAYNAIAAQTDDNPHITASGMYVAEGIIANNCLPFGTRIEVNNKIYEVQDRMNRRYGCDNFDIFMWDYEEAIEFGVKRLDYNIALDGS